MHVSFKSINRNQWQRQQNNKKSIQLSQFLSTLPLLCNMNKLFSGQFYKMYSDVHVVLTVCDFPLVLLWVFYIMMLKLRVISWKQQEIWQQGRKVLSHRIQCSSYIFVLQVSCIKRWGNHLNKHLLFLVNRLFKCHQNCNLGSVSKLHSHSAQ